MKQILTGALGAMLVMVSQPTRAAIADPMKLDSGQVSGAATNTPSVRVFSGIPFAAPPTGENRWRAPQPVAKWDGVRPGEAFGAPCLANAGAGGRGGAGRGRGGAPGGGAPALLASRRAVLPAPHPARHPVALQGRRSWRWYRRTPRCAWRRLRPAARARCGSGRATRAPRPPAAAEDCLYLNVWTSAEKASDKKPVMVFIYGGGFFSGAGSEARYDSERMAAKGVVAVTLNYRLGPVRLLYAPGARQGIGPECRGQLRRDGCDRGTPVDQEEHRRVRW